MKINLLTENLKSLMTSQNILQKDLAKFVGISRSNISKFLTGSLQPDLDMVIKLCYVLKTTPNELLGWDDLTLADEYGQSELDKYFRKKDN